MASAQTTIDPAARRTPASYALAHFVGGTTRSLFAPTRLMNVVTYIGRVKGNDIVLASSNVSRRHAKLVVSDDAVMVHDLDSHNGVFLNGKKIRSSAVRPGDLLYVGDVCIELRKSADGFAHAGSSRVELNSEITGEEDPAARSLATLTRAVALATQHDDGVFFADITETCRELTEATLAAFVRSTPDGFETPVVLRPDTGQVGQPPLQWNVIKQCIAQASAVFAPHARSDPAGDEVGPVMCVLVDGVSPGVIYLSRPMPGPLFTAREVETVAAVASVIALRERLRSAPMPGVVTPESLSLSAQAKVEAAQLRLTQAQDDARGLTERLHAIEAENLKLRQQAEIDKQAALEAKREVDRARLEATKLDLGLQKTDEEARRARDALARVEDERIRLRETVRVHEEEHRELSVALERERQQAREAVAQQGQARAATEELASKLADTDRERQQLRSEVSASVVQRDALRQAMHSTLPPSVVEHVEGAAHQGRDLVSDAVPRQVAALHLEIFDLDNWAQRATPQQIKERLDRFCAAVAARARANGGRVEQVLGHAHLVSFGADAQSVRAAVTCGIDVAQRMHDVGVVCGLHVGTVISGFFGTGDAVTRIEVGEAPALARGIAAFAHAPSFYASEAVAKLVGADGNVSLTLIGPARTTAGSTLLFSVELANRVEAT